MLFIDLLFIDYGVCEECSNPDTYGVICVKCGECGRIFNDNGFMIDDGGTHEKEEFDD